MLLPFLSAILGITAFLPVNFYPAGFVFLVPLFVFFTREEKFWQLIFGALIFKFVFFLGTIYFTLEPLAWGSGLLIFAGLPVLVWLIKKSIKQPYAILILLPFLWTFFDILHARYFLLPTYGIAAGNALGSSPFLGLANFGGIVSLTFFAAIINILVAMIIIKFFKTKFVPIAIIFIFILLGWQISDFELKKNLSDYNGLPNSLKLATVSVGEKFSAGQFDSLKKELAAAHADLVVFPEDIIDSPAGKSFSLAQNTAKELKINLLAVFDTTRGGARYGTMVRDTCLPKLTELEPGLGGLIPPDDMREQLTALTGSVTEMRSGFSDWTAYLITIEEGDSYDADAAHDSAQKIAHGWFEYRRIHGELNRALREKLGH